MPRNSKPPTPHLQPVADTPFPLNIPEEQKAIVMEERRATTTAYRQLQAPVHYCKPRQNKPLEEGKGEELHWTDNELALWRDDVNKQGLNAAIALVQGVVEVKFFGPDQTLNACFFSACAKLGISTRYAIGRGAKPIASSILFKLREDEERKLDDDYAGFRPKPFTLEDSRRGVIIRYSPPVKKGSTLPPMLTLLPGSLLWAEDSTTYDLFTWRDEAGAGGAKLGQTSAPAIGFFDIVRAAAYAAILNIIPAQTWQTAIAPRVFAHWLARIVHEGQAINANVAFSRASRAIIADPKHAEDLLALICQQRCDPLHAKSTLDVCLETFQAGRRKLGTDSTRTDVAGWSAVGQSFGEEAKKAFRTTLYVGADSSLLEDYAERYLLCSGTTQFIDRKFFFSGSNNGFFFSVDSLRLRHANELIQTLKKPIEAFPLFVKSKLRQDVTDAETHPDQTPGAILRITRQDKVIDDDEYAPDDSRLVFNDWRGLDIKPAKSVDEALRAECNDKLDHMLSLVTNGKKPRAEWIKAHIGWTLKHPGKKQQVALVCTGDQGTGKSFLCTNFAQAVFGHYASTASVKALEHPFYMPGYIRKLWVSHDEVVSRSEDIEVIKDLIRSVKISGQRKGVDVSTFTTYARLAFTSNEANPGLSRSGADRGLFQVTSITAASEGLLPAQFQDRMKAEVAPFYEAFAAFLARLDVRQTYVKMLMDCAPERIGQVEDITHSAVRDEDVASEQLTPAQMVAKVILESGTMWGGWDIAMPFGPGNLMQRVKNVARDLGLNFVGHETVREEFVRAGILRRPEYGNYMFDYKIGALQRLFGQYLGVPLHSHWKLDVNDDMPNDWHSNEDMIPWKGKGK